ncbi:MAG: response regulator [Anaerolineaceae bacterium]|nr:response regulator [Anaerolineaceae bacterium]
MNELILLVDDNPRLLSGARLTLEMRGYKVIAAANGNEALQILQHTRPDLIVSDVLMPGCDGFALLEKVHANPEWVTTPFLFLTALNDPESLSRGRALGADDYLTKPFSPGALFAAVQSRLERSHALENAHTNEAYLRTILVMANAIEARDAYTGGHVERVAAYAQDLARALGWPEQSLPEVKLAGVMHDVGKVAIPDAILNKPDKLTPAEWEIMRTHPAKGVQILAPLGHSQRIMDGVGHHHERYDGHGYPDGLKGEDIPETGRLVAIADSYDAMTSSRAYRPGFSPAEAIARLQDGAGTHYDPHMVDCFIKLIQSGR